jgi:hypothetical protein
MRANSQSSRRRARAAVAAAAGALLAAASGTACSPKIYVIDRQTVLEQEAAGDWPQLERELVGRSMAQGPLPLGKLPPTPRQQRLYNVLNGELVAEPSLPAPATGATDKASGQRAQSATAAPSSPVAPGARQ